MSVNKGLRQRLLIGLVSMLILPALAIADDTKSIRQDSDILSVDFTDYYLSVQAQNADINDLFKEISLKTGVKIIAESPIDCQISIDFKKKGFTRGMKLIISQLGPDEYKGKLKLGKTFAGSIYTIRRISEQEISARREKASSFNSQGEKLLGEGKDYQAYSFFIKALRSDRIFLPAHKNLVSIYELWEEHEKLSKRLETAMAQMNTKKNIKYFRKISEARDLIKTRQFEHARETLSQAVDTDPSNIRAYELMAMVHELGGDHETAIKWRKRLAGLVPDDPKNLLLLGRDFRILSRYKVASEYLTKAKELSQSEYMRLLVEKELELMK